VVQGSGVVYSCGVQDVGLKGVATCDQARSNREDLV